MISVQIPSSLRKLAHDRGQVEVDGGNVREILTNLDALYPGIAERILDGGELRRFVNVYVGGEDIRFLEGLDTKVQRGNDLSIIPAVAGGATELDGAPSSSFGGPRRRFRVGLLGCGTVGSAVAQALLQDVSALDDAAGVRCELAGVAVRDPHKSRPVDLSAHWVTTDALAVAIDPDIDIVIELIGGIEPALTSIKAALADNKIVITANKELLAGAGADLLQDLDSDLHFEGSVCGGIPIVRAFKESLSGDRVESFTGIFSGTCNYVLSRMTERRCSFIDALTEAQHLGFAEADPAADIEAFDAAAKVAILARIAFGLPATIRDVQREGISTLERSVLAEAASQGLVCKLIGGGRRGREGVELWVKPTIISKDHELAGVGGFENAVVVETRRAGRLTFQGAGAGGHPTAAAVLGDLVTAVRRRVASGNASPCLAATSSIGST